MVVGDWVTQPKLHAHHWRGWGPRWRHNNFFARLRFARLDCLAAQVAVAKGEEVMKDLPKKLLPLTLFAIAVTSLFCIQPAQAFTMTLQQVGSNVVANGSGAFNLSGLTGAGNIDGGSSGVRASIGFIGIHPVGGLLPSYDGFTGPTSFGSSEHLFLADASNGNSVAINGLEGILVVPVGYVSGNPLSNTMTFNNATLDSLGVTPGTYVWTWGTGLADQNFMLQIGSVGVPRVPDGGSTVSLLGFVLLGLAAVRRKLVAKAA